MKIKDSNKSLEWQRAWEHEYQKQGIPSSFRNTPARVVTEFYSWLKRQNFKGSQAADLGCGRGKNSIYLASNGFSVTALDLLKETSDYVAHQANLMKLPIVAHAQNVSNPWPITTNSLDIAIDIFCYKHVTNKDSQRLYREELARTLKPTGYYFVSLASETFKSRNGISSSTWPISNPFGLKTQLLVSCISISSYCPLIVTSIRICDL